MPIRKNKIRYRIDLKEKLKDVRPGKRKEAARAFGEALRDKMFEFMDNENSPVSGRRRFRKLTDGYRKRKLEQGASPKPDLKLSNAMRRSIKVNAKKSEVELAITDSLQKKKAYNHNVGDTLPRRQFIPDDNGKFKRDIINAANKSIKKYIDPQKARRKKTKKRRKISDLRKAAQGIELEDIT